MRGRRRDRWVAVAVIAAALLVGAAPADAQKPDDPSDPAPRTSIGELPPVEGGDLGDDEGVPPLDPVDVALARSEGARAAYAIRARIKEVAAARVDAAQQASTSARDELADLTARYVGEAGAIQADADDLDELQLEYAEVVDEYHTARDDLQRRVALLYTEGPSVELDEAVRSGDPLVLARRDVVQRSIIGDAQIGLGDAYLVALDGIPEELDDDLADIAERREFLADLEIARRAVIETARAADAELLATLDVVVPDIVFPIAGTDWDFIDSFLFCRDGCTRLHQGVDIMAPHGTELLAVERGVLFRLGTGRLGGIKLWLLGESGTTYYYAHLAGYAPAAEEGALVEAGTVIGYVGNTGNAISTPPHLHFEVHPNGGSAVNPYPLSRQAADLRLDGPDPLDGVVVEQAAG